jgi:glycosyltransferase involved in cell wall biosynthesis
MGLTGLLTARLLGLPAVGIYHTDIPRYVNYYTQDEQVTDLAARFARWFYAQMDRVYVPSQAYLQELAGWGIPADRLRLFPKAVDLEAFHPRWRDPAFWRNYGLDGETKLLYVGRLAREKDLDVLAQAYRRVRATAPKTVLVVVGDGPYRDDLQRACDGLPVVFAGFLSGEELSRAYASSDLFVFPSSTDTFGNVLLEAQASGLPVIASDAGGPKETLKDGVTGIVTRRRDVDSLGAAICDLVSQPERRQEMAAQARHHVEHRTWDAAFREFWDDLADIRNGN